MTLIYLISRWLGHQKLERKILFFALSSYPVVFNSVNVTEMLGENDGKLHFPDKRLRSLGESLCTNNALCNALTLHFSMQLSSVFNRALIGMLLSSVEISVLAFFLFTFFLKGVHRNNLHLTVMALSVAMIRFQGHRNLKQSWLPAFWRKIQIHRRLNRTLDSEHTGEKEEKKRRKCSLFFLYSEWESTEDWPSLFARYAHENASLCDGLCSRAQLSLAVVKLSRCLVGTNDSGIWFETRSREGGIAAGFQPFSNSLFGESGQECEWF